MRSCAMPLACFFSSSCSGRHAGVDSSSERALASMVGSLMSLFRSLVVPSEFLLDGDPALLAEQSVQMNWLIDRSDAVFRKQDDPDAS